MSKTKLLPLFVILIASTLILPAYALTWYAPTYPFYASMTWHGAMYFNLGFTATNGSFGGDLLKFTGFNYAGTGVFGSVGFAAGNDTTMTLLEVAPTDHLLINTNSVGTLRNVTIWLPTQVAVTVLNGTTTYAVNVTAAQSWSWDEASHLLHITAPIGLANVLIRFAAGANPVIFVIPQWFLDQGGSFFGVANFFSSLISVMTAFATWFAVSVTTIISLIFSIMTLVTSIAGAVIYWFGGLVSFIILLFNTVGAIWSGTSSIGAGLGDVISFISPPAGALTLVFLIGFLLYYDALGPRCKKSGRNMFEVITGDVQVVFYWISLVWEWSWLIFNFVYGVIMQFVSLLWSLIP